MAEKRMVEIIPSINVPTFEEAERRMRAVEPYVSWCHLDVTDGVFSRHETWRNPADLPRFRTPLKAEVHLMIENPDVAVGRWFAGPVRRVIVHLEASRDPAAILDACRAAGIEAGFAIKPETHSEALVPWLGKADLVQLLAVNPGPSGQALQEDIYRKARYVRDAAPSCILEIDGGITAETAGRAATAGANILVAGSAIFNAPDVAAAIALLRQRAQS